MEHPPDVATPEGSSTPTGGAAPAVDVERLADAVYRLMLADTRLEQSRAGGTSGTRPRG
jgi:hypothetical protein